MSTINSNGSMAFGNALGGSVTIVPKNDTATNYTVSIPDVTAQVAVGRANDSAVMTALNAGGSAPIYACRAWVNFNGTGTVAIRASGNVSSITDNGMGDYTVNFTTAMPNNNYSISSTAGGASGGAGTKFWVNQSNNTDTYAPTTTSTRIGVGYSDTTYADCGRISVQIFI